MNTEFVNAMKTGLEEISLSLSDQQMNQFYQYYELLIEWNKVMNLTAITKMEEVVIKHFIDSLSFIKVVDDTGKFGKNMIDVGTGAGFPGIPIKIAFPEQKITLLDSLNKRVKFLNEVISLLSLENIIAVHGRAEDVGRNLEYREQYDYCVSRAVANIATLSEYCIPFVKTGGFFVSYKSGNVEEELTAGKKAVKLLGGKIDSVIGFQLPGDGAERTLVKIKKIEGTSKKYPRKAGMPGKEPLG